MRKYLLLPVLFLFLLASACQPAAPLFLPTTTPSQATPTVDLALPPTKQPAAGEPTMTPNPTQAAGESLPVSDFPPLPGDSALERGNFFVDAVTVLPQENRPGAYRLAVEGSLPTPCNQLRVQVNPPDAQGNIVVDVYSVVDPAQLCTQVLKPFAGFVATLGGYPPGNYNVVVNDQPPVKIEIK